MNEAQAPMRAEELLRAASFGPLKINASMNTGFSTTGSFIGSGSYTGASLTHPDMRRWVPFPGSADADLLLDQGLLRSRSRDLVRNHGVAEGALQTITDNVVGVGLRLSAAPDYKLLGKTKDWAEEWSNNVEALWRTWAGTAACDAARCLTFDGLTTQIFRSGWENGEGLALPLWLPDPRPAAGKFSTRLQVIEPDRLCNPNFGPDSPTLRGGVEIDGFGGPLAYWIKKTHPGDRYALLGSMIWDWERIPATTPWGRPRVIHAHDKERSGQTRGKPKLASVMRQFKVLGDYTNAELKAAVVNAMVALVTESTMGQEQLVELLSSNPDALKQYQDGLSNRNRSAINFREGLVVPLALGEKISSFSPARPSTAFDPFTTMLFRHIAAGLNIPYELLMKDFSKTNYSSARAALNEAWRFFKGRRQWLSTYWASPVYTIWLEEAVNTGVVEAPDFYENQAAWCRARWIGAGRGWVDPLKEAQASRLRMDSMVSTLERECAEQGEDWEEVLEQRAAEQAKMKELGLQMPALTTKIAGPGEQQPGDTGAGSDKAPQEEGSGAEAEINLPAWPASEPAPVAAGAEAAETATTSRLIGALANQSAQPINIYHRRPLQKWRFSADAEGNTIAEPIEEHVV